MMPKDFMVGILKNFASVLNGVVLVKLWVLLCLISNQVFVPCFVRHSDT